MGPHLQTARDSRTARGFQNSAELGTARGRRRGTRRGECANLVPPTRGVTNGQAPNGATAVEVDPDAVEKLANSLCAHQRSCDQVGAASIQPSSTASTSSGGPFAAISLSSAARPASKRPTPSSARPRSRKPTTVSRSAAFSRSSRVGAACCVRSRRWRPSKGSPRSTAREAGFAASAPSPRGVWDLLGG